MVSKAWVEKTIYWDICRFLQSCLSSSPEFCPGNQIFFPKTWGYEWNTQHGDIGEVGPEFQSNHRFKRCLIPCRYCDRSLPVCKNQIGQIFQNWEKSTPSRASPDGTPSEFSIQEFANTKWCLKPRGWVQVKGALLHLTVELYPKTLSEKYMTQPPKYIDMYQSTDLTAVQCTFWTKLNDRVKPIWVDNVTPLVENACCTGLTILPGSILSIRWNYSSSPLNLRFLLLLLAIYQLSWFLSNHDHDGENPLPQGQPQQTDPRLHGSHLLFSQQRLPQGGVHCLTKAPRVKLPGRVFPVLCANKAGYRNGIFWEKTWCFFFRLTWLTFNWEPFSISVFWCGSLISVAVNSHLLVPPQCLNAQKRLLHRHVKPWGYHWFSQRLGKLSTSTSGNLHANTTLWPGVGGGSWQSKKKTARILKYFGYRPPYIIWPHSWWSNERHCLSSAWVFPCRGKKDMA